MALSNFPHANPEIVLFDWHATLANTHDGMYQALNDVVPKLAAMNLIERLVKTRDSRSVQDAKLVRSVRENGRLGTTLEQARKISRTDIFEILFGRDDEAKRIAHAAFDARYASYCAKIRPNEDGIRPMLTHLKTMGVAIGILSNRKREFMEYEVGSIDGKGWLDLFDTMVCGDDVPRRKPAPDPILQAVYNLGEKPGSRCWYIGDSSADVVAAKLAGVTAVFYNGANWSAGGIDRIFPGTTRKPHRPDVVIECFDDLLRMANFFTGPAGTDRSVPPTCNWI
ncbi:MAG: HAD-IA family hydrolase [Pseudomonadota bacterium]|nr:HAD-IA family hydrolase [Pseudomonadota bacterium]